MRRRHRSLRSAWTAISLAAALTGVSCSAAETLSPEARAVRVDVASCGSASGTFGSGILIGDGRVLTTAHTVARGARPTVTDRGGITREATVLGADFALDLAILAIDGLPAPAPAFGSADASSTGLVVGGAVSGTVPYRVIRPANITIAEVLGDRDATRYGYEIEAATERGDSGAGVYDAEDQLIGIVFAVSRNGSSTWITGSSEIEAFLERVVSTPVDVRCDPDQSRIVEVGA